MGERDDALFRVAAETVESLAGLLPCPRESPAQSAAPWEAAFRVTFEGAGRGELRLTFFGGAGAAVAAGMIGRREGADAADALGELANIVCGNFLPFVYGAEARCRLSRPTRVRPGDPPAGAPGAAARLPLGSGRLDIEFREGGRP